MSTCVDPATNADIGAGIAGKFVLKTDNDGIVSYTVIKRDVAGAYEPSNDANNNQITDAIMATAVTDNKLFKVTKDNGTDMAGGGKPRKNRSGKKRRRSSAKKGRKSRSSRRSKK
jgi:hypothetical protein